MTQILNIAPQKANDIAPDLITCAWHQAKELALDYPLLFTIATVAFAALGITLLVKGAIVAGVVSLATMLLLAAPLVSSFNHILNIFCSPPDHLMSEHVFTEKACEGGRLYYQNDVPILEISSKDPKQAGFVHGYLVGKNIHEVWKKYLSIALPVVSFSPCGESYFKGVLDKVDIPEEYRLEMEGLAEGYNKWLEEYEKASGLYLGLQRLTAEDVMVWHAFLDLAKATPQPFYLKHAVLGCSTAACLEDESIYVGRNLDWEGLGVVGKNSLVILRSLPSKKRTAIVGCAGAIGCLTGMNDQGVVTVVNEAGWNFKAKGMPYNLWHRQILENCSNVEEARAFIRRMSPAGSHILTVADPNTAAAFEMQLSEETAIRERSLNSEQFFAVTNHFHKKEGGPVKDGCFGWDTEGRMSRLMQAMHSKTSQDPLSRLHAGLQNVQSKETFQTILIDPKEKYIYLNFNNSFAAKEENMHLLSRDILFASFFRERLESAINFLMGLPQVPLERFLKEEARRANRDTIVSKEYAIDAFRNPNDPSKPLDVSTFTADECLSRMQNVGWCARVYIQAYREYEGRVDLMPAEQRLFQEVDSDSVAALSDALDEFFLLSAERYVKEMNWKEVAHTLSYMRKLPNQVNAQAVFIGFVNKILQNQGLGFAMHALSNIWFKDKDTFLGEMILSGLKELRVGEKEIAKVLLLITEDRLPHALSSAIFDAVINHFKQKKEYGLAAELENRFKNKPQVGNRQ